MYDQVVAETLSKSGNRHDNSREFRFGVDEVAWFDV